MQASSTFVKSEAMLGIVKTEDRSQKDRALITSKTDAGQNIIIIYYISYFSK